MLLRLLLSDGDQGRPLPPPLEPGIEVKHGSQPIGGKLHGQDKLLAWYESTC